MSITRRIPFFLLPLLIFNIRQTTKEAVESVGQIKDRNTKAKFVDWNPVGLR